MQSDLKLYHYKNDLDAIKQIRHTEGVRGLYRAYGATVMSFGPYSALYFMLYEKSKGLLVANDPTTYLRKIHKEDDKAIEASHQKDIGFFKSMACSIFAGGTASVMTNPLDIAKLRLQVQRAGLKGGGSTKDYHYQHMIDAIFKIGKEEGVRALFNGSSARVLYHVPMTAISMSILEEVKPYYQRWMDRE